MEAAARRRIPGFLLDFVTMGLGNGACVARNRQSLSEVRFLPRYLSEATNPDISCHLFGRRYDAPFGVAPMGLSGLVWAHAEVILAAAAKAHNVPYTLSTFATVDPENIRPVAGENAWFQLYSPKKPALVQTLLDRCRAAGYDTVMLTVDVPAETRREHDIRNGLVVPPTFDLKTVWQMVSHPHWALRMLRAGIPQFETVRPYYAAGSASHAGRSIKASVRFIKENMGGHITAERFAQIRAMWPGKLLVKGVLDPAEAREYLAMGADGLVVSNHGGRQLDAAPAPVDVLPCIREAVGPEAAILVDGGVRSGLDIARMLALGANFVLLGRPFLYAVAALDRAGGEHAMRVLKAELRATLGQLGCPTLPDLPKFLYKES
jgi:L-lactate dehydrogenase (cytochrome)